MDDIKTTKTRIRHYNIEGVCPECNRGKLNNTGKMKLIPKQSETDINSYLHENVCDNCGHKIMLENPYPYTMAE